MEFDRLHEEEGNEASVPIDAEEGKAAFSMLFLFGWNSEKNQTPLIPIVLSLHVNADILNSHLKISAECLFKAVA